MNHRQAGANRSRKGHAAIRRRGWAHRRALHAMPARLADGLEPKSTRSPAIRQAGEFAPDPEGSSGAKSVVPPPPLLRSSAFCLGRPARLKWDAGGRVTALELLLLSLTIDRASSFHVSVVRVANGEPWGGLGGLKRAGRRRAPQSTLLGSAS
jgi:hypothetical protein